MFLNFPTLRNFPLDGGSQVSACLVESLHLQQNLKTLVQNCVPIKNLHVCNIQKLCETQAIDEVAVSFELTLYLFFQVNLIINGWDGWIYSAFNHNHKPDR